MKVKDFIEELKTIPEDYNVEIRKMIVLDTENAQAITLALDYPIMGVVLDDTNKDMVLMVGSSNQEELIWTLEFGKVIDKESI